MNLLRKIRALFRKEKLDAEMSEEMRLHLERRTEENLANGALSPEEARYAAMRRFGSVEQLKAIARDQRGLVWLEELGQDVRYALRQLRKAPGFTAVAVLSLALGIGANTAVFSLVDEVLLKMLPVKNPSELVLFQWSPGPKGFNIPVNGDWETDPKTKLLVCSSFSQRSFESFGVQNRTLSALFAFASLWQPTLLVNGEAEAGVGVQLVSGGYHEGLGGRGHVGRLISPDDDRAGAAPVAVISHRYWQQRFGGAPSALGQSISVNRVPVTIVGVTPPDFLGTQDVGVVTDVSLPLALAAQVDPGLGNGSREVGAMWWLRVMGRRAAGVTPEQVRGNFEAGFQTLGLEDATAKLAAGAERPAAPRLIVSEGGRGLNVGRRAYAQRLTILITLVGLVLLIACANVANLLLARGAARRREIAARLALGASRGRIVRQLLTESGLLAFLGAAAGVMLAYWGRGALVAINPLPGGSADALGLNGALDWRVLVFTAVVAGVTGILFGLPPALRATRINLNAEFQAGGRNVGGGARSRLVSSLMCAQVALSLVLLVAAGLFVRTLRNLEGVDIGFNRERLLLFTIGATPAGYDRAQFAALHGRIAERIGGIPGVRAATFSWMPLLSGTGANAFIALEGRAPAADGTRDTAMINAVSPEFFGTLEIPLQLGRGFTVRDDAAAPKVAVINETMAQKYFPGVNPVGRRFGRGRTAAASEIEIVGVVRDAKYVDVKSATPPTAYLPFAQAPAGEGNYAIRTVARPEAMIASIRAEVRAVDPKLPLAALRTQEDQLDRLFATERMLTRFAGIFGALALALVCVGLYGLMSYAVTRRTSEFGVRMALGAHPGNILGLVLRDGTRLIAIGIVSGLAVAFALSRLVPAVQAQLFELSAADPVVFSSVAAVLVAVGLAACWLPARRATKIDPIVALRSE